MTAPSLSFPACAEAAWQARRARLGVQAGAWEQAIAQMGEGAPYLRYVLSTLPLSDLGEYPPSFFVDSVRHALRLREGLPWCRALPEDMFLQHVLYPRINTEGLAGCRPLFYEELAPRVAGLTLPQAILEVNRWCAEHVTYRSTDDRTSSPLAVYRRGWGRCGEESTFTVTALRSVGIAARQIYAPWWSHCDDNHAWVEAWDGSAWRYLGACEPEPELDRGWFTSAAARAMLIHTRTFVGDWPTALPDPGETPGFQRAAPLGGGLGGSAPKPPEARRYVRDGVAYELVTARYAPTRMCRVLVTDSQGQPVAGAAVAFSVLNMAAWREVARLTTDGQGAACLELGLGSVHVLAEQGGCYAEALWDTGQTDALALQLAPAGGHGAGRSAFTFRSPAAPGAFPPPLTPAQKASRRAVLEEAAALRAEKRSAYIENEPAALAARVGAELGERAGLLTALPPGYAQSLREESQTAARPYQEADAMGLTKRVLALLTEKDCSEPLDPQVVAQCAPALALEGEFPQEVFEQYLLCPRIGLEPLCPWRGAASFAPELRESYRQDPRRLWQWVERNCAPLEGYQALPQSPLAALALGMAGEQGRRALFCGLCRQNGIPARLSPLDGVPEYWQNGGFVRVGAEASACLVLSAPPGRPAMYGQGYSLSRLEGGAWQALHTSDIPAGEARLLGLPPGLYRLLAILRLPDGSQLASQEDLLLAAGERRALAVRFPQAEGRQLLGDMPLPPFSLFDPAGRECPGQAVLSQQAVSLVCWLEPGREPTEHLLLELREAAGGFCARQKECAVHLATETGGDAGLALEALPFAKVWQGDFEELEGLARQLFVDPERLPLVLLADRQGRGLYACSGYNVGVGALLLALLEAAGPC